MPQEVTEVICVQSRSSAEEARRKQQAQVSTVNPPALWCLKQGWTEGSSIHTGPCPWTHFHLYVRMLYQKSHAQAWRERCCLQAPFCQREVLPAELHSLKASLTLLLTPQLFHSFLQGSTDLRVRCSYPNHHQGRQATNLLLQLGMT